MLGYSQEEINLIINDAWSIANSLFPDDVAAATDWVKARVTAYGIQEVNSGVNIALQNPLVLVLVGLVIFKVLLK